MTNIIFALIIVITPPMLDLNKSLRLRSIGASKDTGANVEPNGQPRLKTDHGEEDDVCMDMGLISVYLPRAVAPEVVPVVLEYLYTDKLNVETINDDNGYARTYIDPGTGDISEGDTRGDTHQHAGRSKGRIESTTRARALMMKRSSGQHTANEVRYLVTVMVVLGGYAFCATCRGRQVGCQVTC